MRIDFNNAGYEERRDVPWIKLYLNDHDFVLIQRQGDVLNMMLMSYENMPVMKILPVTGNVCNIGAE